MRGLKIESNAYPSSVLSFKKSGNFPKDIFQTSFVGEPQMWADEWKAGKQCDGPKDSLNPALRTGGEKRNSHSRREAAS